MGPSTLRRCGLRSIPANLPNSLPNAIFPLRFTLPSIFCRRVATSRRTAKALRVKPAPSAAPAHKRRIPILQQNSIVFNPPPTAPSPYQTPPLFLPPSDPRRILLAPAHAYENPHRRADLATKVTDPSLMLEHSTDDDESDLPVVLSRTPEKKYHLGEAEIQEIRRLRSSNPWVWTRKRLAQQFGCSEYFVGMCAQAIPERMEWHEKNLERIMSRWGPKRQRARQERTKRRNAWGRDE